TPRGAGRSAGRSADARRRRARGTRRRGWRAPRAAGSAARRMRGRRDAARATPPLLRAAARRGWRSPTGSGRPPPALLEDLDGDGVADTVAHNGGNDQEPVDPPDVETARRSDEPRGNQERIAGQEEADEEPRLGEDDPDQNGVAAPPDQVVQGMGPGDDPEQKLHEALTCPARRRQRAGSRLGRALLPGSASRRTTARRRRPTPRRSTARGKRRRALRRRPSGRY